MREFASRSSIHKAREAEYLTRIPRTQLPLSDQAEKTDLVLARIDTAIRTSTVKSQDIFVAEPSKKEAVGSQAFRLEYGPQTPRKAIYDDVVTYLGEYRLQASETFYDLLYSREKDGVHIRDMNRGDALVATAEKAIQRGEKLSRRIAERDALQTEEKFLETAQDGDIIVQASPPGNIAKEDGNYGFIFVGKVEKINDEQKIIHKNAIRVNNATIDQYNQALSEITGKAISHTTPEQHIGAPHFLGKERSYKEIQLILNDVFNFEPSAWERRRNEWIIEQVKPYVHYFIDMIHGGSAQEKSFNFLEKIENKVLALKATYKDVPTVQEEKKPLTLQAIQDFKTQYDYKPPAAGGSCGPTGSDGGSSGVASSTSFTAPSSLQGENEDQYGKLTFTCHNGHPNTRERGELKDECAEPGCGKIPRC